MCIKMGRPPKDAHLFCQSYTGREMRASESVGPLQALASVHPLSASGQDAIDADQAINLVAVASNLFLHLF